MANDNSQSHSWQACEASQSVQSRPKVLCIDDDPNISAAIARRLRGYDVDVVRAYHGMHGYWLAVTEKPAVIITDLRMPQGDGELIIECLKRNAKTVNIPVIVLTGKSDPGLEQRLLRLGAEYFFPKPISFDVLLDTLGHHIELCKREDNAAIPAALTGPC